MVDDPYLTALPAAVYATDADGHLTYSNEAALELWGRRPNAREALWCGALRLWRTDGTPLDHADCPLARLLRGEAFPRGSDLVIERPDGGRTPVRSYPKLLHDKDGQVTGAVNLLIDLSDEHALVIESERLAAIVSSSDDAIVGKTLEGIVTSWNGAATRIFGYEPQEMIGQPILTIIPAELQHEEARILAALRRGERIEHFDTVRLAKDGHRVEVSLTVSPIRDRSGTIVGASKVARDISQRRRQEELQKLLLDELNHRVKNTLAMIQAIASQSLRRSAGPNVFVASFQGRVQALAQAHDLIVERRLGGAELTQLVQSQVALGSDDATRITVAGPVLVLDSRVAVQMALVLHELATNARKYGALASPTGHLAVTWQLAYGPTPELSLEWTETGVPGLRAPSTRGFGTTLIERSLASNGGGVTLDFAAGGLVCSIRLPLPDQEAGGEAVPAAPDGSREIPESAASLGGKRILVVEDEPLVALEIEAVIEEAGGVVVGPAATFEFARRLIDEESFDAALLDANLGGERVDALAAALARKGVPFAFASGYGRDALPSSFRTAPLIGKPFEARQLVEAVFSLLADKRSTPSGKA